ncbi:MAG: cobalamin biosynthesis protein CbiD [Lachnospiraceae bacterium]|nr:cobalamin biosynthesis protein CbiD [Lachnospiraceae bacterium]
MEQYIVKNQKKLRCGITTGTCAAAAARAAAEALLLRSEPQAVQLKTPGGTIVSVPVTASLRTDTKAEFVVEKDSGDDPDVTNHARIYVSVAKLPEDTRIDEAAFRDRSYPQLVLDGGEGIGRVTREGLEQRIGQAAINQVPRRMIFDAVGEVCELTDYDGRLEIVVRIPEGEELAKRTFNKRLGIEGGISVLGTSGIIEPMSERAIVDTIEARIRQLSVQGKKHLLVTPGNYGQGYVSDYLKLDPEGSVKCSNYIGETLDLAVAYGMESILLVGNIGKLVKLAAGIMNTHSKVADGRCEILAVHTVLCGGNPKMAETIMQCINTEEILTYLEEWGLREKVMESLCKRIDEYVGHRVGDKLRVGVALFSEKFGFLGQTKNAAYILQSEKGVSQ